MALINNQKVISDNIDTQDRGRNPIQSQSFQDTVTPPNDFNYRGSGMMPIARTIQSANYVKGVKGWKLDSNGTTEIN